MKSKNTKKKLAQHYLKISLSTSLYSPSSNSAFFLVGYCKIFEGQRPLNLFKYKTPSNVVHYLLHSITIDEESREQNNFTQFTLKMSHAKSYKLLLLVTLCYVSHVWLASLTGRVVWSQILVKWRVNTQYVHHDALNFFS